MIEKQELGEFYKELRLARKLKQSDVACAGLTASQLSKFELGQSMLSADKLILAIQGINMTFDEFGHKLTVGGSRARTDGADLSSFELYCD